MSKLKQSAKGKGAAGKRQQRRQKKFKAAPATQRTNILREDGDGGGGEQRKKRKAVAAEGGDVFGLAGPKLKKYKQGPFERPPKPPRPAAAAAPEQPLGKRELKAQRDELKARRKPHFASVQARRRP